MKTFTDEADKTSSQTDESASNDTVQTLGTVVGMSVLCLPQITFSLSGKYLYFKMLIAKLTEHLFSTDLNICHFLRIV